MFRENKEKDENASNATLQSAENTPLICQSLASSYTGWRRPVGCFKLQVIFHKRATNYRVLLQKMTRRAAARRSAPTLLRHQGYSDGAW
jgi:hypothetical protein